MTRIKSLISSTKFSSHFQLAPRSFVKLQQITTPRYGSYMFKSRINHFFFKLNSIENQHRWMHLRKSHRLVILSNNSKQYLVIFGAFSIVICKWSPQMISNVIINTVIQRPSFSLGILLEIL